MATSYKIGIVSGAGPEAGALLYTRIIKEYQKKGAWEDWHFPEIVLYSYPFSDMMRAVYDAGQVRKEVNGAIVHLRELGCAPIVMACQTAHLFLDADNEKDVLHLIRFLGPSLQDQKEVRIVASKTSSHNRIHAPFLPCHCEYLDPEHAQQNIYEILRGDKPSMKWIQEAAKQSPVILGCTEFSLLFEPDTPHILDPISLAAKHIVEGDRYLWERIGKNG